MKTEDIKGQSKKINSAPWLIALAGTVLVVLALSWSGLKDKPVFLHGADMPPCLHWQGQVNKYCIRSHTDECDYWQGALEKCKQAAERWEKMSDDEKRDQRKKEEDERREKK